MNAYHSFLNELINENHSTFRKFENLKWINPYQAIEYEEERDELIHSFSEKVKYEFKDTKPWINQISKGCRLCGEGEWSCLFITGRCNANIFYCPAPQDSDDLPTAQKLEFEDPRIYADFINHFGFKGCSFSGGEPLLAFDRALHFLKTIRENCSPELYIWMYTNGILASEDKFKALADAGINEVRFDIGATNYNLKGLKKAGGIIPNITVEIPAVPEELDRMKELIPQLWEAGVTNLNLHQLRLTQHNVQKIADHGYTYLHGEQPAILESELAALDIIRFVDENNLGIGVNYCNFQYKNRFQKAGYRSKVASRVFSENETVTENGFIRKIHVPVDPSVKPDANGFIETPGLFRTISADDFLKNHQQYSYAVIEYSGIILHNQKNKQPLFELLNINNEVYPFERGKPCNPIILKKEQFPRFIALLKEKGENIPDEPDLFTLWKHEKIEFGRRNYF
ncbi:MAG TPA: radical SAM protein [Marinilabiliales bacterium]|nr:radical SAM protein [Marinilabiliales bacterium]